MSSKHLAKGSVEPARKKGLLRLYSMQLCPFAQRSRLVLRAKGIPHDIVNINLIDTPEWYFQIHPEGKVPALLDGDKVVVGSMKICDYLEDKYPQNPLYPAEPALKAKDKKIIQKIDPAITVFATCIYGKEEKSVKAWGNALVATLQPLEEELAKRETALFGGNEPNMIDYALWPWGERAGAMAIKLAAKLSLEDEQIPLLRKWRKSMLNDSVAAQLYHGPEIFWRVVQIKLKNVEPNFDSVFTS
nr:glutathione S-transferase [Dendroctonus rhizophagus]